MAARSRLVSRYSILAVTSSLPGCPRFQKTFCYSPIRSGAGSAAVQQHSCKTGSTRGGKAGVRAKRALELKQRERELNQISPLRHFAPYEKKEPPNLPSFYCIGKEVFSNATEDPHVVIMAGPRLELGAEAAVDPTPSMQSRHPHHRWPPATPNHCLQKSGWLPSAT